MVGYTQLFYHRSLMGYIESRRSDADIVFFVLPLTIRTGSEESWSGYLTLPSIVITHDSRRRSGGWVYVWWFGAGTRLVLVDSWECG